jgi:hypothetical protein
MVRGKESLGEEEKVQGKGELKEISYNRNEVMYKSSIVQLRRS